MDIQFLGTVIGVFLLICLGIFFIIKQIRKKNAFYQSLNFVFLEVTIPKKESKEDMEKDRDQSSEIRKVVGVAEHFFSTLHGFADGGMKQFLGKDDFMSLEYIATDEEIRFFVGCPQELSKILQKQITSFYPEAVVEESTAPKIFSEKTHQVTKYLSIKKDYWFPFKTYLKMETTDPVSNILNSLSNASDKNGNSAVVQFMIKPVQNNWQNTARKKAKEISSGKKALAWWNPLVMIGAIFSFFFKGSEDTTNQEKSENNESQETTKAIEEKAEKPAFETIIRMVTSSKTKREATTNMNSLYNSFVQFDAPSLNGFTTKEWYSSRTFLKNLLLRAFVRSWHLQKKMIFSTEELSSLFHFPHIKYNPIPGIKWQNYKIVKAPQNIPQEGLFLGHNIYRGEKKRVCMKRDDRFRHFYVIGQTGTGKTSIFQTMIRQDLRNGEGLCIIDPHGSLIEQCLPFVPKSRIDDVVIFDPSDLERPLGLNLLEAKTEEEKEYVALESMNLMIKMFDEETFGPRIQDYFRNGVLTLISDPNGGTLIDIVKLFTDEAFQKSKIKYIKNPVVKSFWFDQMAKTGAREKAEIIPYFAAKFGAFISNAMLRNIIGQSKSAFDFSKVMEEGKILFMNLSKGTTGEINSKLLGMIIVSKIQTAALQRQKALSAGNKPRDFFLYIDEFQNYVTDSIESILSEARKYRLSLNIAHQYIGQIDSSGQKKGVNLKDAIFGNVGTMMCYKIGAQDAEYMAKEMNPVFTDQDLINIDKFKAVMKLSVDTQPSRPFSIIPDNPYLEKGDEKVASALKQISRLTYGRSRKFVEKEIFTRLDI